MDVNSGTTSHEQLMSLSFHTVHMGKNIQEHGNPDPLTQTFPACICLAVCLPRMSSFVLALFVLCLCLALSFNSSSSRDMPTVNTCPILCC